MKLFHLRWRVRLSAEAVWAEPGGRTTVTTTTHDNDYNTAINVTDTSTINNTITTSVGRGCVGGARWYKLRQASFVDTRG